MYHTQKILMRLASFKFYIGNLLELPNGQNITPIIMFMIISHKDNYYYNSLTLDTGGELDEVKG